MLIPFLSHNSCSACSTQDSSQRTQNDTFISTNNDPFELPGNNSIILALSVTLIRAPNEQGYSFSYALQQCRGIFDKNYTR